MNSLWQLTIIFLKREDYINGMEIYGKKSCGKLFIYELINLNNEEKQSFSKHPYFISILKGNRILRMKNIVKLVRIKS